MIFDTSKRYPNRPRYFRPYGLYHIANFIFVPVVRLLFSPVKFVANLVLIVF